MRIVLSLILALNVGVFLAMVASTGDLSFSAQTLLQWGGNAGAVSLGREFTGHAEPWRLLTATYLHAGLAHLAGNVLLLVMAGRLVQAMVGQVPFLAAYTACGVLASALSAWGEPYVVSVGASGAIAGVVGILVVLYASSRTADVSGAWVAQTVGINALYSFAPNVDWRAHLGGFLAGLVAGVVLLPFASRPRVAELNAPP